jgi:hypothetical protein
MCRTSTKHLKILVRQYKKTQVKLNSLFVNSGNADAFHWRGKCKLDMKDYANAYFDFTMAMKINKNSANKDILASHISKYHMYHNNLIDHAGQSLFY